MRIEGITWPVRIFGPQGCTLETDAGLWLNIGVDTLMSSAHLRQKSDCLSTGTVVCLMECRMLYIGAQESLQNVSRSGKKG